MIFIAFIFERHAATLEANKILCVALRFPSPRLTESRIPNTIWA